MQHRVFQLVSSTSSAQRLSLAVAWLLVLMTLQLGVLNPVACLIDCLPHVPAAPVKSAPVAFFCLVPEAYHPIAHESPVAPMATSNPAVAPQAAYAFVLVALALMTLLASERMHCILGRVILPGHSEPPLVPPPQAL